MQESLELKHMCSRKEVQEIIDKFERHVDDKFTQLREERDSRMREIAVAEINQAKDNIMKFIGWGGIVGIGAMVYFFGGLTGDVEYLQNELSEIKESQEAVEDFMNRGDRYTSQDGIELKAYVDQQDEYILRRVDDGFESLGDQINRLHGTNN